MKHNCMLQMNCMHSITCTRLFYVMITCTFLLCYDHHIHPFNYSFVDCFFTNKLLLLLSYKRGWFYHKEHRMWYIRVPNMEPLVKTNTYERGSYHCFDPSTFETVRRVSFCEHTILLFVKCFFPSLIG